jgi:hypothetical protein
LLKKKLYSRLHKNGKIWQTFYWIVLHFNTIRFVRLYQFFVAYNVK